PGRCDSNHGLGRSNVDVQDDDEEALPRLVKRTLLPTLRRRDVLVLDNLAAHKSSQLVAICASRGVSVLFLPPYSPDLNPIEAGWALQKQFVRRHAPRHPDALRRVARRSRYRITALHLQAVVSPRRLPGSSEVISGVSRSPSRRGSPPPPSPPCPSR